MPRVPFSGVDALMCALDEPSRPQTIEQEVGLGHRLDEKRLRAAIASAAQVHPMARARRLAARPLDPHETWNIDDELVPDPLTVEAPADDAAVDRTRNAFSSAPIDLRLGAPFRVLLCQADGGDRVMLSVNHGAFDGVAALRLLQSISRAYAGEHDSVPDVDPLTTAGILDEQSHRIPGLPAAPIGRPARLRSAAGGDNDGFGVIHRQVEVHAVRRRPGATVNDMLVAGLHRAVEAWLDEQGTSAGTISVMTPVNARPAGWRGEVVANLALTGKVTTTAAQRRTVDQLVNCVVAQTTRMKSHGVDNTQQLARGGRTPVALRRLLPRALDVVASTFADTTVLSNLGRVGDPPFFGGAGTGLWFGPPPRSPLNLTVGAVTTGDTIGLSFRWCRRELSDADVASFSNHYRRALDDLAAVVPPPAPRVR